MKKLFYIVGILAGLYLIFVFALFTNAVIFPAIDGELYDCSVEKNICAQDLMDISQKYDLTVFTNEYRNTAAFSNDIVFYYMSISKDHIDNIQMGVQPSLFPSNKIIYEIQKQPDLNLQRFWVMQNNHSSFGAFLEALKEYDVCSDRFYTPSMNAQFIFAEKNVEFFSCMSLFLLFCMASYYVIRSKEIAVLKMNGCSNISISARLSKTATIRILTGFCLITVAFSVYVGIRIPSLLSDYLKLCLYVVFSLLCVLFLVWLIGSVCINAFSIIPALKNDKNNKIILGVSIAFKIFVTLILLQFAKNVFFDIHDLNDINHYTKHSNGNDFYYFQTSVIPDATLTSRIHDVIKDIDDNDLYNYAHPMEVMFGDNDTKTIAPVIRMSYNMLNYISVCGTDGTVIEQEDLDDSDITLLIPVDMKERTGEIVESFTLVNEQEDSKIRTTVCYIASRQEHCDFLDTGIVVCNAIYCLQAPERGLYFNGGRVLFHRDTATVLQERLDANKFEGGTVCLAALSNDYQIGIANIKLKLVDDIQFLIVNAISFVLAVVAIATVYCELRKKEIAVCQMISIYPKRVILFLGGINVAVTITLSIWICHQCFLMAIPEIVVYIMILNHYRSKRVLAILKGE